MIQEHERITIRVPTGLKKKVDKRIADEDLYFSRSELIRHLLQNFLTDERRRKSR
jgi:metal-responsive CopG/Arc/MetJ family transcriptional regulator|tara:strand:+ start:288 stop:452 length:165 start_codon:yes stop_codon:yes gene_type:complete